MHSAVEVSIQSIHREIAPFRVFRPILCKRNFCMAPIGRNIYPQGRDFKGTSLFNSGNRAVGQTSGHHFNASRFKPRHRVFGGKARRNIKVFDRLTEQRITHTSADEPGQTILSAQCAHHFLSGRLFKPRSQGQFTSCFH